MSSSHPSPSSFNSQSQTPNSISSSSSTRPHNSNSKPPSKSNSGSRIKASSARLHPEAPKPFTALMQDRQARGQDPNGDDDSDSEELGPKRYDWFGNESYESVLRRRNAANILDRPELLMMRAQGFGQTLPQARHALQKILCGFSTSTTADPNDPSTSDPSSDSLKPGTDTDLLISETERERERALKKAEVLRAGVERSRGRERGKEGSRA